MKNNGQVLVLFVILLPVILLTLIITIEIGNIYLEKQKNQNTIKNIIRENLKEPNSEKINTLIEKNIKNIDQKNIFVSDDEIRIYIKQNRTIFGKEITIEYKYKGIKQDENINISEG